MRELAGLLFLLLIAELVALLIVCVQAWRNPHGKEPATRVPDHIPPDPGPPGSRWRWKVQVPVLDAVPDYVPDDWLGGGSPHETRPGGGIAPYDRDDEYPGWGIPDGDTKPATDTPSGDRGMEGQGP